LIEGHAFFRRLFRFYAPALRAAFHRNLVFDFLQRAKLGNNVKCALIVASTTKLSFSDSGNFFSFKQNAFVKLNAFISKI